MLLLLGDFSLDLQFFCFVWVSGFFIEKRCITVFSIRFKNSNTVVSFTGVIYVLHHISVASTNEVLLGLGFTKLFEIQMIYRLSTLIYQ